jgi:hypothetical protein
VTSAVDDGLGCHEEVHQYVVAVSDIVPAAYPEFVDGRNGHRLRAGQARRRGQRKFQVGGAWMLGGPPPAFRAEEFSRP